MCNSKWFPFLRNRISRTVYLGVILAEELPSSTPPPPDCQSLPRWDLQAPHKQPPKKLVSFSALCNPITQLN